MRALMLAAAVAALLLAPLRGVAQEAEAPRSLSDLPPELRLGVRVEMARRQLPVAPVVVIVPDAGAYLDALARWTMESRFPVLIDDGADASRERIAGFVRAFEPERVLRWDGDGSHDLNVSESLAERQARLDAIVARAWGAESRDGLFEHWRGMGFAPPGVVVSSLMDRAWPGAVALAAGRGQVTLWMDSPPRGRLGSVLPSDQLRALDSGIAGALDDLGIPWRETGDIIDAVTLCLNMPTKIPGPDDDSDAPLALTDRIGRHADTSRWGWCGLVHGDESESVWRAMCALFLQPDSAWLFNGYRKNPPFDAYDIAPAAALLREMGLRVDADASPENGQSAWRSRAAAGVDAGFIHVNSSGSSRRFNLSPGRPYASEVPLLWKPAIVHFVHSFSAQNLDDARSIAPTWLANGAYAYVGSVHEPFLNAFFTPEALVQRLAGPAPLGVAARKETGRVWRINVLGDPLITLGPPPPEAEAPDLPDAESLEDVMRRSLREGDMAGGIAALMMLGRDADAARLMRAIIDDRPEELSADLARAGWLSLVRTGQRRHLMRVIDALPRSVAGSMRTHDILWLALRRDMERGDVEALRILQERMRPESFGDDAVDLARAVRFAHGASAAERWLAAMRTQAPNERNRKRIDDALRR